VSGGIGRFRQEDVEVSVKGFGQRLDVEASRNRVTTDATMTSRRMRGYRHAEPTGGC
jgi:hypothetical protein